MLCHITDTFDLNDQISLDVAHRNRCQVGAIAPQHHMIGTQTPACPIEKKCVTETLIHQN